MKLHLISILNQDLITSCKKLPTSGIWPSFVHLLMEFGVLLKIDSAITSYSLSYQLVMGFLSSYYIS